MTCKYKNKYGSIVWRTKMQKTQGTTKINVRDYNKDKILIEQSLFAYLWRVRP